MKLFRNARPYSGSDEIEKRFITYFWYRTFLWFLHRHGFLDTPEAGIISIKQLNILGRTQKYKWNGRWWLPIQYHLIRDYLTYEQRQKADDIYHVGICLREYKMEGLASCQTFQVEKRNT